MPQVTIILPSFNHDKYIKDSIDSVLNQSFSDFELIIWDDASTDNSWDIIQSYKDTRIRTIQNKKTQIGIFALKNAIEEMATTEYIAIQNSDDSWALDKLEKQVKYLNENKDIGGVFTYANPIDDRGKTIVNGPTFTQPNRSRHEWLNFFFSNGYSPLCHPSAVIRKKCYEECGAYRNGFTGAGDFDMWTRLCQKYEIYIIPEKLVNYRKRDSNANSSSVTLENNNRLSITMKEILKNFLKIKSSSELIKIFPSVKRFVHDDSFDSDYIFAMLCLERKEYSTVYKSLAFDLLHNIMANDDKYLKTNKIYGFNYTEFDKLCKTYNVYNSEYAYRIQQLSTELAKVKHQLSEVHGSKLWKILNIIKEITNKLRFKIFHKV